MQSPDCNDEDQVTGYGRNLFLSAKFFLHGDVTNSGFHVFIPYRFKSPTPIKSASLPLRAELNPAESVCFGCGYHGSEQRTSYPLMTPVCQYRHPATIAIG